MDGREDVRTLGNVFFAIDLESKQQTHRDSKRNPHDAVADSTPQRVPAALADITILSAVSRLAHA